MFSVGKKAFFDKYVFEICPEVYEPAEDSFLFAENLNVKEDSSVLDMGTGCGILGIISAEHAREVIAVDLNPNAVRCAKQNAKRNSVDHKMTFVQSDLFDGIAESATFDLILFNAPYVPSSQDEDMSWLGRAWAGGLTGRQVIDKFIAKAPFHLNFNGKLLLLQSNLSNIEQTLSKFAKLRMCVSTVALHALPFFEKIVLLEAEFEVSLSQ